MVYFLLAEGDGLLRKIVRAFPRLKDRKRAVDIAHEMEQQISGYLFFTTVMNVALRRRSSRRVMWLLGMPNPMLWGFVAGVTKFIPYLGGLVCTVVLGMASIVAFDDIWWALLVPIVFLAIDTVHGNVAPAPAPGQALHPRSRRPVRGAASSGGSSGARRARCSRCR